MARQSAKAQARRIELEQRRQDILHLRVGGASIQQIANELQLSKSTVHGHIAKSLDELSKTTLAMTAQLRALNMQRLDRLLLALWPAATNGKDVKATREARNIIAATSRLLGLEAPVKIAHTDPTGEIERSPADWVMPVPPERDMHEWAAETREMLRAQEAAADKVVAMLDNVASRPEALPDE